MKRIFAWLTLLLCAVNISPLMAQEEDSLDFDISAYVWMDSLVVTASRHDFDVKEFIEMVQKDQSFYKAFRNLRRMEFQIANDIRFYDKKGQEKASYTGNATQYLEDEVLKMTYADEDIKGKFFKRNKRKKGSKYYTAQFYEKLFLIKDGEHRVPAETYPPDHVYDFKSSKGYGRKSGYVVDLKKLIFQPGTKINLPLIGNKTAIFSKKMQKRYDYTITSETYKNGIECYVFTVKVKDDWKDRKQKTVIKHLETYFAKDDFQVVARNYQLAYPAGVFEFDVTMKIELGQYGEHYVPTFISYDGVWDVPARKPEKCKFEARFSDFKS